jgi:hypothetical protein
VTVACISAKVAALTEGAVAKKTPAIKNIENNFFMI